MRFILSYSVQDYYQAYRDNYYVYICKNMSDTTDKIIGLMKLEGKCIYHFAT